MLRKIISIRNTGRFLNSAAPGNPELSPYALIVGANGSGKTTLCAVFRSLKTGDPDHILGRRTLGAEEPPRIELLFPGGPVRFDGTAWSMANPDIAIFDSVFVAENVYAGEVVEIDQRRNLYRIIIGPEGVRLAEEDARLAAESRAKTGEISGVVRAVEPHIPRGMRLEAFLALATDPDIDAHILEQERALEAVRQAKVISERASLAAIPIPDVPGGFADLLARTLDDIAKDSEAQLAEHLAAHGMEEAGGNWIATGLEHTERDTCPFCGQDIRGLPLIAAFRSVFSERYKSLRDEITAMRDRIIAQFGEGALGRLAVLIEQNKNAAEFWQQYCAFDPATLAVPEGLPDAIHALGQAALTLLDRKDRAPLEPVQIDAGFREAAEAYGAVRERIEAVMQSATAVNRLIAAKKEATAAANIDAATAELTRRKAIKVRHTTQVAELCSDHVRLTAEKAGIDTQRERIRGELNTHTTAVLKPYERRINDYLDAFNADFKIAETGHGYPGGTAASTYRLVINERAVDIGDGRTPSNRPSFKNTLSAGDRTTLALAFFLANLAQDPGLTNKIVVFDDPFNSQDAFRRRQTVHQIAALGRRAAQVIVLSHDATFLKQVWDKAPAAERVALTLADHRAHGSKITSIDLERACQGRTATDVDDLQTYVTTGAGNTVDLIRKTRAVLETYCWTTYPSCFEAGQDWLGEIVRKIREGGDQHPAADLYDPLDQINDYTKQYYHGEDMTDVTPDDIDARELTGYVRRTLRIVNALQA